MKLIPTNITTLSLIAIALFSGVILSSSLVSADDDSVVDEINITVPVSCTLSGTGMNTHNAEINNGQYNSAIGETTLKAFCNDNEGFAIYAIGYTDNEEGKNVLTNSTLGSNYDIVTGTATSGNNSNWAMKLSTITSPTPTYPIAIQNSFDAFHNVPNDYTLIAKRISGTDTGTSAEGSTLKTTYQAYISKTQPAGTYTGQVKYTLVHPHDTAAPQKPITIEDVIYMQDFINLSADNKVSVLASMVDDTTYYLTDSRDNKTYGVAKLKDGNIWMAENLDLGRTALTADLTSSNTNLSNPVAATTFNGWKKTQGSRTYDDGEFISLTTSNTANGLDTDPVSGTAYGTLYNYYAVSAGTISGNTNNNDAIYDICPAGWRLPTGGLSGEFQTLYNQYSSSLSLIMAPIANGGAALATAGYFYYNTPMGVGDGYYWTSTRQSNTNIYSPMLDVYEYNELATSQSAPRVFGYSVRCLAK